MALLARLHRPSPQFGSRIYTGLGIGCPQVHPAGPPSHIPTSPPKGLGFINGPASLLAVRADDGPAPPLG